MAKKAAAAAPAAAGDPSMPRRLPVQQRSRERVDRMLDVATSLIAAQGSDALRMSEVADKSGVSIGSLYQYFPDKAAIIRTLAERSNAEGRACVAGELQKVTTEADLRDALCNIVDGYYAMFIAQPVMLDIWSATQTDKVLQEMDAEDGRAHGAMLAAVLQRLHPAAARRQVDLTSLLLMHLIASAVRLAIALPRAEADDVIAAFKEMSLRDFRFATSVAA